MRLTWLSLLALPLACIATPASAQTAGVVSGDASRGTAVLPGSSAFADEATALVLNPAGLVRSGPLSAWYFHERSAIRGLENNALFASATFFNTVALGAALEWLEPLSEAPRRTSSLGLAVGSPTLSLGVSGHWHHGSTTDGLFAFDIGLSSKPWRWLALGLLVRNLNAPSNASAQFEREYTLGLGLRPFREALTLGVDFIAPESHLSEHARLQYTVAVSVVHGVRLLAGVSHGVSQLESFAVHGGLGIDLEHVGYTQGAAFAQGRSAWQFAVRASADAHRSVVPQRILAVVDVGRLGSREGGTLAGFLGVSLEDRFLRFLRFLEDAAADPEVEALVLKVDGSDLGLARSDEIRRGIAKLKAGGKKVYAYLLSATDAEAFMVSGCDAVFAAPQAMLLIDGLRSSVTYFGEAAEDIGIHVDVARVGKYKNSPDQFTRRDMSAEQREALTAYLDTTTQMVSTTMAQSRNVSPAAWQAFVDEGLTSPRRAVELGALNAVMAPRELEDFLKQQHPDATLTRDYQPSSSRTVRWGARHEIAIVPVLGTIASGRNTPSPLGGPLIAGAASFIEALQRAATDDNVKAIVVRVDSGGGDGLASDLMYRAVLEAKKHKPVIASMGDAAASGGYYVAMGADEIFASPTTLTGSIGVFFLKPAIRPLAERLGIHQETVSTGALAGITDLFNPWTQGQREAAQRWVDEFYQVFIAAVAMQRHLEPTAVDAVAQGRIWSGAMAKERGLVDSLGGLLEAVSAAKQRAGLGGDDDVIVSVRGASPGLLGSVLSAAAPGALLEGPVASPSQFPEALAPLVAQLGSAAWVLRDGPRLQARLEFGIEIK